MESPSAMDCFVASHPAMTTIPPLELSLWRQRHLAGLLSTNQVATHGNHGLAAFGPEHRHDIGGAGAPITPADNGLLDLEGVHQRDDIHSNRRRLTTA